MMDVVAVDWSGKRARAAEHIWLAQVSDGKLHRLENGREREALVDELIAIGRRNPRTVVGLDFSFSFPRWYLERRGWASAAEAWRALGDGAAADILGRCPAPFWGRPGVGDTHGEEPFRRTEREQASAPKSVFQIGGAGAVGTGSLRGMPFLARLRDAGFSVWPFDPPGGPLVVEIYPRLLTGPVRKSRHAERLRNVNRTLADQPEGMRERAAGSEDAFDAAVSAVVMARHLPALESLAQAPPGSDALVEGSIWTP